MKTRGKTGKKRSCNPSLFISLFLGFILSFSGCADSAGWGDIKVAKVFDGDTLLLENGEKVRLIGIDSPEAYESEKLFRDARRSGRDLETIKAMGQRASRFTRELVEGRRVRLEFDEEQRDHYGRLLVYVYIPVCLWDEGEGPCKVERAANQHYVELAGGLKDHGIYVFLNASLLHAGFAQPMTIPPNVKYTELFQSLYEQARENNRGLWGK